MIQLCNSVADTDVIRNESNYELPLKYRISLMYLYHGPLLWNNNYVSFRSGE